MKNVLKKRLPRFLKRNIGIYGGIALFIILVICLSASYVVGNQGIRASFHDMEDKNGLEDGFFALSEPMDKSEVSSLLGDALELVSMQKPMI